MLHKINVKLQLVAVLGSKIINQHTPFGNFQTETMESSWTTKLLALLSILQILLHPSSAINSQAQLASLLKSSQNCLIVSYIQGGTAGSEQWAKHLLEMAEKTSTPIASYTTGASNNTAELEFVVNCKLFLVYVETAATPSVCEQLLTSNIPLASDLATENERVIFVALQDINCCMESALLREQDMDQLGNIAFTRPFVIFLQLELDRWCYDPASTEAVDEYHFQGAYKIKLFCASSWACFVQLNFHTWRTFDKQDRANLNLWEVLFRFRGTPTYNQDEILAIASAPLYKLRIGAGLNPRKALGAPFI